MGFPITHDGKVVGVMTFLAGDMPSLDDALVAVLADLGQPFGQFVRRTRAEAALRESERGFRALFDDNPQPMYVWEKRTFRILAANVAAVAQYGYTQDEFLTMTVTDLRLPEDSAQLTEIIGAIDSEGRREFTAIRHRTKGGRSVDIEIDVREVDFEGRRAWLTVVDDVTERLRLQRKLEHQAFHDALTDLPNRALFRDRVEHVHRRLARSSRGYAVLMLDLDNFKTVNDSFGHGAGDELLLEVSRRLADGVRQGDTAARLGGDEFGIVLEDLEGVADAVITAERLLAALREPFAVAGRSVTLGATIGIALSGDAAASATDVVRNADVALYAGKPAARIVSSCSPRRCMSPCSNGSPWSRSCARASPGETSLRHQPKVDAESGRVVGVEALVHWNHPVRGMLVPAAFIAVAEECGSIVDLDAWVLEAACRQAGDWARSAACPLSMAVNVSGRDLEGGGLLDRGAPNPRRDRSGSTAAGAGAHRERRRCSSRVRRWRSCGRSGHSGCASPSTTSAPATRCSAASRTSPSTP